MPDAWRRDPESAWIEVVPGVTLEGAGDLDESGVRADICIAADGHTEGWDAEERALRGVVAFADSPAPTGLSIKSATPTLIDVDGAPTRTWIIEERPLADAKVVRRAQAQAEYDARLAVGFPVPGAPGETLQLRNESDRSNWLTLKDACNDAILAGLGAEPCALPIRTTANNALPMSWEDAATLLRALRAWGAAMLQALWTLKDVIDAAETIEALEALDLAAGWPEA